MGLFSRRIVDRDVLEWQFEHYEWLIDNLSTGPGLPDSELWLPIPEHFGSEGGPNLTGRAQIRFAFKRIKAQCGLGPDADFSLRIIDTPKGGSLGGVAYVSDAGGRAGGTYEARALSDGSYKETLTIDRALADRPTQMIATLAHETAHALHGRTRKPLEVEPELYELFTDLTAIYLGYGVFLANSRFEFGQFSDGDVQGWQAQGAGYLPEADMIMATAIFMGIKRIPIETALPHLKPRLRKMLMKAFKQLKKHEDDIHALRERVPPL